MVALPPFVKDASKLKAYSRDEVKKHRTDGDLWMVIDSYVWEYICLSKFADMHPGGTSVLLTKDVAGQDATTAFFGLHRAEVLTKYSRYLIGYISGETPKVIYPTNGAISEVPYAEPAWLTKMYHSPYFTEGHRNLAKAMRLIVDEFIIPEARAHELSGKRPSDDLLKVMGEKNIAAMRVGPGKHLHGLILPGGMKGEDYDYLGEMVVTQEIARLGARGYQDGLGAGMWIGITPILNFGTAKQKEIVPDVLSGKKHICLAISEPWAGSDVAGIRTTADLSKDGTHFIVNGQKKWITNGVWSDYFTTAVRTAPGKISMLLIHRSEGVETKPIATSYSAAAGTAYISFENVKVPRDNLIGELHNGFGIVLSNFNHERNVMNMFTAAQIRMMTSECFKWAHQREVFGKRLIDQPVIRQKLGAMFAKCEAGQAWLEHVTYNMSKMSYAEQSEHLAGVIALLKTFLTRCAHEVADDAVQIFGGRGLTKGGMGNLVELFQRTYKFDAVLGGSEEILNDLGVKQAMKKMNKSVL